MPPGAKPPAKKAAQPAPRPMTKDPDAPKAQPKASQRPRYLDPGRYPGLLTGSTDNVGSYGAWLRNIDDPHSQVYDPFSRALINAYGPAGQEFAWEAYSTEMDDIDFMNRLNARFPDWQTKLKGTTFGAPGPGGGGSRGGGGRGGGGGGAATPEQIAAAKAAIKNRVATLGLPPMTDDVLTFTATTVVRDNWTDAQLDDHLLADPAKVTQPGEITATIDQIKKLAADQLLGVSDSTAREWSTRISSGEMTLDAVRSIFQQQAMGEFGWAAQGIAAGQNVRDMLMPARDRVASELELNPDSVDLMDPRWRSMMTVQDEKSGLTRAATMTEVTRNARKDGAFAQTNRAQQLGANALMLVRNMFEG